MLASEVDLAGLRKTGRRPAAACSAKTQGNRQLVGDELMKRRIKDGEPRAWCACCWTGESRSRKNWRASQLDSLVLGQSDEHIVRSLNAQSPFSFLTEVAWDKLLAVNAVRGSNSLSRPVALPSASPASGSQACVSVVASDKTESIFSSQCRVDEKHPRSVSSPPRAWRASVVSIGWSASQTGWRRARQTLNMAAVVVRTRRKASGR